MKEEAEAAVDTAKSVLQDLVVVVSLVRTLTESFGSASDLYRKLKRKSKLESDSSDDAKDTHERRRRGSLRKRRDSSSDSARERRGRHHTSWKVGSKDDFSDSDEEIISTSSSQVLAEYDRGYRKLGEPFARGDLTTQCQLQSQIIQLQHTLLSIHQDYMLSTYLTTSSSHSHLIRLIQTTRSARMASIQALHMQYQRMLSERPSVPDPPRNIPGAYPTPPRRTPRHDSATRGGRSRSRGRSRSSSSERARDPGRVTIQPYPKPDLDRDRVTIQPYPKPDLDRDRVTLQPYPKPDRDPGRVTIQPYPMPERDSGRVSILPFPNPTPDHKPKPRPHSHGRRLFCVYARDLQEHPRLPLTDNYKAGGDNLCPFCHAHVTVRPGKAWEIIADGCKEGDKRRVFLVKNRFVVKCHREEVGFACVLCARFKDSDTTCRDVGLLMEHLWKDHTGQELEKDDDVYEIDE